MKNPRPCFEKHSSGDDQETKQHVHAIDFQRDPTTTDERVPSSLWSPKPDHAAHGEQKEISYLKTGFVRLS